MKVGIRYIVTKASNDGTLEIGDKILLCDDGSLLCCEPIRELTGWINACDIESAMVGAEYKIDEKWKEKRLSELKKQLSELEGV